MWRKGRLKMRKRSLFKTVGITFLVFLCLGLFYFAVYSSLGGHRRNAAPNSPRNKAVIEEISNEISNEISSKTPGDNSFISEIVSSAVIFGEVITHIKLFYIDDIKNVKERLVYPAIKVMVSNLDPYSHFFTPAEVKKRQEASDKKEFRGIGISYVYDIDAIFKLFEEKNGAITLDDMNSIPISVVKVYWDSPAEKEGVEIGDVMAKINGVFVEEIAVAEIEATDSPLERFQKRTEAVRKIIADEKNDFVELTVKRGDETKEFCLTKDIVKNFNVYWDLIGPREKLLGYLRIESFEPQDTGIVVGEAVADFKDAKAVGVILDMRGNLGGLSSNGRSVLGNFLEPDTLIITKKDMSSEERVLTGMNAKNWNIPMVVLVDNDTASASEVVTGVLRDYKRAIILGEKTYGKGVGQKFFGLSDGSEIWLTNFRYYLPSGECIHGKGIKPQIEMDAKNDEAMLQKAEEILSHWRHYKKAYLK